MAQMKNSIFHFFNGTNEKFNLPFDKWVDGMWTFSNIFLTIAVSYGI